jgi:hypothetical protein
VRQDQDWWRDRYARLQPIDDQGRYPLRRGPAAAEPNLDARGNTARRGEERLGPPPNRTGDRRLSVGADDHRELPDQPRRARAAEPRHERFPQPLSRLPVELSSRFLPEPLDKIELVVRRERIEPIDDRFVGNDAQPQVPRLAGRDGRIESGLEAHRQQHWYDRGWRRRNHRRQQRASSVDQTVEQVLLDDATIDEVFKPPQLATRLRVPEIEDCLEGLLQAARVVDDRPRTAGNSRRARPCVDGRIDGEIASEIAPRGGSIDPLERAQRAALPTRRIHDGALHEIAQLPKICAQVIDGDAHALELGEDSAIAGREARVEDPGPIPARRRGEARLAALELRLELLDARVQEVDPIRQSHGIVTLSQNLAATNQNA